MNGTEIGLTEVIVDGVLTIGRLALMIVPVIATAVGLWLLLTFTGGKSKRKVKREVKQYFDMLDDTPFEPTSPKSKPKRGEIVSVSDTAQQLDHIIASMKQIRSVDELVSSVPRNMRDKLKGMMGHEMMRMFVQIVATEGEAIVARREDELRAALAINQAHLAAQAAVILLHKQLATLEVMQKVMQQHQGKFEGVFEEKARRIIEKDVARLQDTYRQIQKETMPDSIDLDEILLPPGSIKHINSKDDDRSLPPRTRR